MWLAILAWLRSAIRCLIAYFRIRLIFFGGARYSARFSFCQPSVWPRTRSPAIGPCIGGVLPQPLTRPLFVVRSEKRGHRRRFSIGRLECARTTTFSQSMERCAIARGGNLNG